MTDDINMQAQLYCMKAIRKARWQKTQAEAKRYPASESEGLTHEIEILEYIHGLLVKEGDSVR